MNKKTSDKYAIGFFGTPEIAVFVLEELEKAGILPAVVITQPDKPAGRGLLRAAPPAKEWALAHGTAVIQPKKLSSEDPEMDILFNTEWDLFVVAAYGTIIPAEILKLPRHGTLNVHPSLLPRFRGPTPIESAILADEKETGVTIMLLDEELDHGPIVAHASITSDRPLKAGILGEILARAGGKLLAEVIPPWIERTLKAEPQEHAKATFTKKIRKEDGLLDISADDYKNYLKFCAYDGWPGTYFFTKRNGKNVRVKIIDAEYTNGSFLITRIIPEGKKEMAYEDFMRI